MPSRLASSSSDRTRPVASSSNHARPRTTALISAGSHLEGWFCGASPGNTILVATPRRLKSTAAVNSIVLAPGASDTREGKSPLNSAKLPGFSQTAQRFTAETDSPLEGDGLERSVPDRSPQRNTNRLPRRKIRDRLKTVVNLARNWEIACVA